LTSSILFNPNAFQSLWNLVLLPILYFDVTLDVNMVVSAPTGSGKTTIFELAIVHQIMKQSLNLSERKQGQAKIIYLAPLKVTIVLIISNVVGIMSTSICSLEREIWTVRHSHQGADWRL
jgi:Lhr-like helicase